MNFKDMKTTISQREILNSSLLLQWNTKVVLLLLVFGVASIEEPFAQTQPITPAGLNTQVSGPVTLPSGKVQYDITEGTRSGANLFHSFGDFNVPANNIANFKNAPTNPVTSNILSRVTGGKPSNIFGIIQTEGFGNANLFLLNPAGIVFGPTASLNIGGDTHFTTADYLKLADGIQFTAFPSAQDAILSMAPVTAFGFLGSNPSPISVEGSALSVKDGQTLSLIGGDMFIEGNLKAAGGKIGLVSVASPGEVLSGTFDAASNMNGESFAERGVISLSGGTSLDVSADAAGTVIIRGGELIMVDATISADTINANGETMAVDIQISDDITIIDTLGNPAITARTTGSGNAGAIHLSSAKLDATSSAFAFFTALIDSHTSDVGLGGDVNITVRDELSVVGNPSAFWFFVDSGTSGFGGGQGGNISISGGDVHLKDTRINSGDFLANSKGDFANGAGGDVAITASTLQMVSSTIATDGFFFGKAGDLTLSASDIHLDDLSELRLVEVGGGGSLRLNADNVIFDASSINLETIDGRGLGIPWVGVKINAKTVELRNGSAIQSTTIGNGAAGDIDVTASDAFTMFDVPGTDGILVRPTGLFTNSLGFIGDQGPSGAINIATRFLEILGGARIDSTTQSSGRGGDVTIIATNEVSLSGARPVFSSEQSTSVLGSTRPSGIFSRTVGRALCTGLCGDAGNISITTGSLNVTGGAAINNGTTNDGEGGMITVNASNNILIAGTLDDGTPGGVFSRATGAASDSGEGGIIDLTAENSFFLQNGATVSARSSGPANAGNIELTATNTILLDGATVTTEAAQASGGDIKLTAQDLIRLNNSTISSSVQGNAMTGGGNISIDPEFIILQNSQVLAKAVEGQGGNISLVATDAILADPLSVLDASSALGVSGSVDIQAPIQNLSGTIAPLPEETTPVTALYGARCASGQGGQFSTFVDSKSDSLSPAPGRFLASPLLSPLVAQANTVATSVGPESHVILTASIAPLALGSADQAPTACP